MLPSALRTQGPSFKLALGQQQGCGGLADLRTPSPGTSSPGSSAAPAPTSPHCTAPSILAAHFHSPHPDRILALPFLTFLSLDFPLEQILPSPNVCQQSRLSTATKVLLEKIGIIIERRRTDISQDPCSKLSHLPALSLLQPHNTDKSHNTDKTEILL